MKLEPEKSEREFVRAAFPLVGCPGNDAVATSDSVLLVTRHSRSFFLGRVAFTAVASQFSNPVITKHTTTTIACVKSIAGRSYNLI